MKTLCIRVDGMRCEHCVQAVTDALVKAGADKVTVDLSAGRATVTVADELTPERLQAALEDIGFDADVE